MNLALSSHIGFRYWRARKANGFASFITFFAVFGILLGVAALIIVSSVMNGLEGQLKQRILGAVPQLTVHSTAPIEQWQSKITELSKLPGVIGVTPSISNQAMIQSSSNMSAIQIYGIYPDFEHDLLATMQRSVNGSFDQLAAGKYRIVLGSLLARRLDVSSGDKVRILSGEGVIYSPLGPVLSQRNFVVAGVFEMGSQVDANLAYVHYEDAQRLMRQKPGEVKHLRFYLDDPFNAANLSADVIAEFSKDNLKVTTSDWRETYGHLFGAVKMEKNMMSLMLSLIIAVAAFNIVSALVMMVVDKTSDVAVLKTQGLMTSDVMGIFMIQGSLNAIIGLVCGLVVGIAITLNLNTILNTFGISVLGAGQSLPVQLEWSQMSLIVLGTLLISFFATVYPAMRAAGVQPADALRHE
ncbi:outer membrane-specific lipoprotein transporter subunit; membrane component of ABC superfamily [Shewanella benthica]|uniref:Outer membrane-specific lipoprotein transporter subunit membrane component of ABC superfamily n=1 Tax=Shewanella benthica TaxID=43661 RepID=A0A330M3A2_9GAMM|nr:lipoprotein-releasing ABC transporter permease subunit [Shewanella benthica]SQH77169.1 outer membrane-specific lipoprotein transporter subunit; membrane component of ABC superfamily [Shewanella benthica]